jgi:1-acyl-sn-glycerol-3-phosphate acyltransferase
MRTVITVGIMLLLTAVFGTIVIVAGLLGVENRPGGIYDRIPRVWSRIALKLAGVRLEIHGGEQLQGSHARVFVSNHVSWYDIFTLLAILPRYRFVAKAELFRIPFFGPAARRAGTIPIQRENRKAAFEAYEEAARGIRDGASVVVCPEGTRGESYSLRPFKKGPFVLAIAAHAPVVPMVLYGTREVQPKGSFRIKSATVHVHFLEQISTAGMNYDDRDRLAAACWQQMADTLRTDHGVSSEPEKLKSAKRKESRQSGNWGQSPITDADGSRSPSTLR